MSWSDFKSYFQERSLSPRYISGIDRIHVACEDGIFIVHSVFMKGGSEETDFESVISKFNTVNAKEVVDPLDKADKTLKLISGEGTFDENGECVIDIQVPGNPANGDKRFIAGGYAFQDAWAKGDRLTKIEVVDVIGMIPEEARPAFPLYPVMGGYHDEEAAAENQGWRVYPAPSGSGEVEIEPIGGFAEVMSGLTLRMTFKKTVASAATWVGVDIWQARKTT